MKSYPMRGDDGQMSSQEPRVNEGWVVTTEPITSPVVERLFSALNAELSVRYTEAGANHFTLDAHEVLAGRGAIFVLYEGGEPVGCSAIRRIDVDTAELKRMYVVPEARGRGVAAKLLHVTIDEARKLAVRRMVLETGERQPEAIALAEKFGFARIERFGGYVDSPLSVCMGRDLDASTNDA
jgi:GNAT superfamily N-acetyltransferase